ncbi:MAG: hypothetical protein R3F61_34315 [Myxococcota bacterium]
MSPLVIMLATPAFALDCSGLDPQLCAAANTARDQINAIAGEVVIDDAHPANRQRTTWLYQHFEQAAAQAAADCGSDIVLDGTIAAHWDRVAYGPRTFYGAWSPIGGSSSDWGPADGTWNPSLALYTGAIYDNPAFPEGFFEASWSGRYVTMQWEDGFGGGVRQTTSSGVGYFATIYGSCVPPQVTADVYEVVGNTPLVAGRGSYGWGEVTAALGLLDNDPDGADLRVVGVSDGSTLCEDVYDGVIACTTGLGGQVYVYEDGTFEYLPPATGPGRESDWFDVVLEASNGARTSSPVELVPVRSVWYLDGHGYGYGSGTLVEPASTLDAIQGFVREGDVVYLSGSVDGGSGVTVSGEVRFLSADEGFLLDVALNGESGPVPILPFGGRATLQASGAPPITVDPDAAPTRVSLEHVDLVGDDGGIGLVFVGGTAPFDLVVRDAHLEASTVGVVVDQPQAAHFEPATVLLEEVDLTGPQWGVGLQQGFHADTVVTLSRVQAATGTGIEVLALDEARVQVALTDTVLDTYGPATRFVVSGQSDTHVTHTQSMAFGPSAALQVEATDAATLDVDVSFAQWLAERPFDLQLAGSSSTRIVAQDVEVVDAYEALSAGVHEGAFLDLELSQVRLAGITGMTVTPTDEATVHLLASGLTVETEAHALHVTNETHQSEGFQAYIGDSELVSFGRTTPTIELFGIDGAITHVTMIDDLVYADGNQRALDARSHVYAETSLTLLGNAFLGDAPDRIEVQTEHPASRMCLDLQGNYVDGYGTTVLRQRSGSEFVLPGLNAYGSGANPLHVEGFVQSQNQTRADVRTGAGDVSAYSGGSQPCMHYWTL